MLDIKAIRQNPELFQTHLKTRGDGSSQNIRQILEYDKVRRDAETQKQALQSQLKQVSKQIGILKSQAQDTNEIESQMRVCNEQISELDQITETAAQKQKHLLLKTPNIPVATCPVGENETHNLHIQTWNEKPQLTHSKNHLELAENLNLLDFDSSIKLSGSGFAVYRGKGAKLQRALSQFLLDLQTQEHHYEEVAVPYLLNRHCLEGTGQLPKFENDLYGLEDQQVFLAPTAEVPLTNLYRDSLLKIQQLPLKLTALTPCFRREAGAAGVQNRGLIRMHQFDKVELVQIVHPDQAESALKELTNHAQTALKKLGLHYRVIELCTGDLGFSACKTYDLEVWAPGQNDYLEVSSCSNFGDYQARRLNLRYKDRDGKNQFCHTLNGSGTALPRLYIALLEQYQQGDGSIQIPECLISYFGTNLLT